MGIKMTSKGSFDKTEKFLKKSLGRDYISVLHEYGEKGVQALSAATPVDTGLTASLWRYEVVQKGSTISVIWSNDNVQDGVNIAVILQYGHAAPNGYWIQGRDYINPALQPIFDDLADKAWKEVTKV